MKHNTSYVGTFSVHPYPPKKTGKEGTTKNCHPILYWQQIQAEST